MANNQQKDPRIGHTYSNYKVISRLGEGGMGVVYKAQDVKLNRPVALKFLAKSLSLDEKIKSRFIQEARAASALDHPRIGTIYQIGETGEGEMFIAMAYYAGRTLKDELDKAPLPLKHAINLISQITNGLHEAHEKGIVHRDIKPANIIFTEDEFIKIVDFGLAKLGDVTRITQPGTTMGTPGYMSPEQIKGMDVDYRADIWSVAVIFYEMLTGALPFKGQDQMSMLYNIVNEPPAPVHQYNKELPEHFQRIFDKAFQKDINSRYSSITELQKDIFDVPFEKRTEKDNINTVILTPEQKPVRKKKSKKGSFAVLLIILLASIIGYQILSKETTLLTDSGNDVEQSDPVQPEKQDEVDTSEKAPSSTNSSRDKNETPVKNSDKITRKPQKKTSSQPVTSRKQPDKTVQPVATASVTIATQPPGAVIYLDDERSTYSTPHTFNGLRTGSYALKLSMEGHYDRLEKFVLNSGDHKQLSFDLKALPPATLKVQAFKLENGRQTLAYANVYIDGESKEQTPLEFSLNGGQYRISAKLFPFEPQEQTVTLKPGEERTIKFLFSK